MGAKDDPTISVSKTNWRTEAVEVIKVTEIVEAVKVIDDTEVLRPGKSPLRTSVIQVLEFSFILKAKMFG